MELQLGGGWYLLVLGVAVTLQLPSEVGGVLLFRGSGTKLWLACPSLRGPVPPG